MRALPAWFAISALALAVSYSFNNSPFFLDFAIQADTLYPALLTEELRADPGAALRFTPSRIPSFLPDLLLTVAIDLLTGSWRLAFWLYGASAFMLLSGLGGWIAAAIAGRRPSDCALAVASLMAVLLLAGLGFHLWASGERPMEVSDPQLPVNLQTLLMLPIWHGGGFIIGLAVVALAWRTAFRASPLSLLMLALLSAAAVVSNTITVAHAILPAMIALADSALRRSVAPGAALAACGSLALGAASGFWLGGLTGRMDLPVTPPRGWGEAAQAAAAGLVAQPVVLAMLVAALPIALAFVWPRRAGRLLPKGGEAAALRFFVVVAAAACAASLLITMALYASPMSWRYAMPLAWWPVILVAGFLPGHRLLRIAPLAAMGVAAAQGGGAPAIMQWRHPALVCLDAADPRRDWRAGLAAYWHARTIAASSDWRRQVESTDFGEGRPLFWIADPRSHVQHRHAARGTPPPYRFIDMTGLDPDAVTRIHGPPERVLPCGERPIWVFPQGWDPVDWLIATSDPLVPQALAIGRQVCLAPERLSSEGLVLDIPAGAWRFAAAGAARLGVSDARSAVPLGEIAQMTEITLSRPARLRIARLDALPLTGLVIAPAEAEIRAC